VATPADISRLDVLASRPRRDERVELGRAHRLAVPLDAHAEVPGDEQRPDRLQVLRDQDAGRVPGLVPVRWGRMSASPFAFFRGAAAIMAADLATLPRTPIVTQLCGDAHLSNFGVFASPDRRLVFDLNDFDETVPGPFEWDVKRLAASVVVAGRDLGLPGRRCTRIARAAVEVYRTTIAKAAALDPLEVWYYRVELDSLRRNAPDARSVAQLKSVTSAAARKNQLGALSKLTEVTDGHRRIRERPPLIVRLSADEREAELPTVSRFFHDYLDTMPADRRSLLRRYALRDLSLKVVGVGSVGTRCLLALFESGDGDALFLQLKEAGPSAVGPFVDDPADAGSNGRRVVEGQRLLQSAPDAFLGWATYPHDDGPRDYYVRQLWDGKASAAVEDMDAELLERYARLCGATLARAHARAGDAAAIAGYLGDDDTFDRAVGRFAKRYAALNDSDHQRALDAIATGSIPAAAG